MTSVNRIPVEQKVYIVLLTIGQTTNNCFLTVAGLGKANIWPAVTMLLNLTIFLLSSHSFLDLAIHPRFLLVVGGFDVIVNGRSYSRATPSSNIKSSFILAYVTSGFGLSQVSRF